MRETRPCHARVRPRPAAGRRRPPQRRAPFFGPSSHRRPAPRAHEAARGEVIEGPPGHAPWLRRAAGAPNRAALAAAAPSFRERGLSQTELRQGPRQGPAAASSSGRRGLTGDSGENARGAAASPASGLPARCRRPLRRTAAARRDCCCGLVLQRPPGRARAGRRRRLLPRGVGGPAACQWPQTSSGSGRRRPRPGPEPRPLWPARVGERGRRRRRGAAAAAVPGRI